MTSRYPGEDAFPPSLRGLGIAPNIAPTVVAPYRSAPDPLPYGSFEGTNRTEWPSFIVVPQVTWPNRWVNVPAKHGSYRLADAPDASLRMAKEIVDAVRAMYAGVDPSRLYITGLSMGGYGVWEAIERWPGYFSAAAPLAGAGDPSRAAALANLPIWAFQGADDTIVPVTGSLDMIAAIRAAGGHPHFTEFAGAGHGIWMNAYSSHDFMSWLFAQRAAT